MTPSRPSSIWPVDTSGSRSGFDRILLYRPAGETIRFHRYVGRWLILRVTESVDDALLPGQRCDVDGIAMNVIVDPSSIRESLNGFADTIALDRTDSFRRCFPGLQWPSTFIIDPAGELVAILSDDTYEPFVQSLVRDGRTSPTFRSVEAIDRGDINS